MVPNNNLDPIYQEMILDLYRNPLNKKVVPQATHKHKEFNPSCGDEIEVMIQFDEHGNVVDVGHQGQGCAISQAAVSLLTEEIRNKKRLEVESITEKEMLALLPIKIIHTRLNCALLGWKTLRMCLEKNEEGASQHSSSFY